jgi:hypothetical protein
VKYKGLRKGKVIVKRDHKYDNEFCVMVSFTKVFIAYYLFKVRVAG